MWKRYIPRVATLARNRAYSSFRTQSTKPSNVYIAVGALGVSVVTYGTLTFSKSTNILCDAESKSSSQIPGDPDMAKKMENLILSKQREICEALEKVDGKAKFYFDEYDRPDNGGYGISSVISDGNVFEKGGVMLSVVHGRLPPAAVLRMKADHSNIQVPENGFLPFFACGLSLIMHPKNPNVPTVHLNYRYFETTNEDGTPQSWWFGGGADLTPYYMFEEDAVQFHEALQEACDKHSPDYYERFKKWCDEYFYNKHRKESRGIGGIFFDDLADRDPQEIYAFIGDALNAFLKSYIPIVNRRKDLPYTLQQQEWQHIRRGRYVEFNLLHDRGTSFGLMAPNARVESILVSLPKHVQWHYMHEPTPNSPEAQLVDALKTKRDWVNMEKYKDAEKKADQDTA